MDKAADHITALILKEHDAGELEVLTRALVNLRKANQLLAVADSIMWARTKVDEFASTAAALKSLAGK